MKKSLGITAIFAILFCMACSKDRNEPVEPVTYETEFFSYILYDGLPESILNPIKEIMDNNYSRVLGDLEVSTMAKVTVRIWNDEGNFLNNMQQSIGMTFPGSGGWVYSERDIRVLNRGAGVGQTVLHEFCHAVSLIINTRIGNNPRWLWEAVAIYESNEFVHPNTISYLVSGDYPTLAELSTDFNEGNYKIYSLGYLLSEYILDSWGKTGFVNLIKSNGNIQETLGVSTQSFEEGWKGFVQAKYF